jgi:DNA-binding beta-propeller fold protein YncE
VNRRQFLAAAAAAPFAVRAGIALADAPRLALVTADTESRVVVVDVANGRVVRSIPTLPGPRSADAVAGGALAVVAHTAYGAVSILDARRVRTVLRDFSEPRYAAAHPDGEHVYVTDSAASEVVAVGLARGRTLGRVRVGGWARHVTIDASGRTLWVGLGTASETVAVVDVTRPERPRLVRHVRPPVHAHDVGFAGAGVWVTSGDGRGLAVYDGGGSIRLRLPAGSPPQHVTFADHVAYVTSGNDGTLRVHALEDGRLLHETAIPTGSYNVQAGHGLVLTPSLDHGTLSVLSRGGELLHRIHAAASCHDACFVRPA